MLDIKFIRDNRDIVKQAAIKKHITVDVDKLVALDNDRLDLLREIEALRAEQNAQSDKVKNLEGDERENAIIAMRALKESLQSKESEHKKVNQKWQDLMLQIPNVPDVTVPDGESDQDNVEVKTWGNQTVFPFESKDHITIMQDLGLVDFERGSKVHGFRGYYLTGDAVKLSFAIWQYALEFFSQKGFNPMMPPAIVSLAETTPSILPLFWVYICS